MRDRIFISLPHAHLSSSHHKWSSIVVTAHSIGNAFDIGKVYEDALFYIHIEHCVVQARSQVCLVLRLMQLDRQQGFWHTVMLSEQDVSVAWEILLCREGCLSGLGGAGDDRADGESVRTAGGSAFAAPIPLDPKSGSLLSNDLQPPPRRSVIDPGNVKQDDSESAARNAISSAEGVSSPLPSKDCLVIRIMFTVEHYVTL